MSAHADVIEEERAREARIDEAMLDADMMILTRGIEGARRFFMAHCDNVDALCGLIMALRLQPDTGATWWAREAGNEIVRYRNALIKRLRE